MFNKDIWSTITISMKIKIEQHKKKPNKVWSSLLVYMYIFSIL